MPTKTNRTQFIVVTTGGQLEGPFTTKQAAANYLDKLDAKFGPDASRNAEIRELYPPYQFR